jgi:hypothetical protein
MARLNVVNLNLGPRAQQRRSPAAYFFGAAPACGRTRRIRRNSWLTLERWAVPEQTAPELGATHCRLTAVKCNSSQTTARMAKLADARDLKSRVPNRTYRFNSGSGHQNLQCLLGFSEFPVRGSQRRKTQKPEMGGVRVCTGAIGNDCPYRARQLRSDPTLCAYRRKILCQSCLATLHQERAP